MAGETPWTVTQADEMSAEHFISRSDGDFPELSGLFAKHRHESQAELVEAARLVLDGLNARIDAAHARSAPAPIFVGISALRAALSKIEARP